MVVDVLLALSAGLAGILCGWFAFPAFSQGDGSADAEDGEGNPSAEDQARLQEVARRLSLLTADVAADVDAHQSQIQAISELVRSDSSLQQPGLLLDTITRLLEASTGLRGQLDQAQHRLQEQTLELQSAEQRSLTDPLTQLANRRALELHLAEILSAAPPRPATMMLIDVDHFKQLNDSFGHRAGDEVLRQLGQLLNGRCEEHGMPARYGGEEFAVVWIDADLDACCELAESIRLAISELSILFEEQLLSVTASMGLAEWRPEDSAETWTERTDRALYAAKGASRNCCFVMRGDTAVGFSPSGVGSVAGVLNAPGGRQAVGLPAPGSPIAGLAPFHELPRSLEGLPAGPQLLREFGELAASVSGVGVAFVTAVVRLDALDASSDHLRILARAVRSMIRGVDRIGLMNDRTIVIGMPHVDHESALLRADRIRTGIGYAFETAAPASSPTVSISLCSNREHQSFEAMLRVAVKNLEKVCEFAPNQLVCAWSDSVIRRC